MFSAVMALLQRLHPPIDPTAAHCVTCNKAGTRAEMHQVSALDFACCVEHARTYYEWVGW